MELALASVIAYPECNEGLLLSGLTLKLINTYC